MKKEMISYEDGKMFLNFDTVHIVTPATPDKFVEVQCYLSGALVIKMNVGRPIVPGETIYISHIEGRMEATLSKEGYP